MSTRFQIAALVFMMTNAVAFGIGIVPILMIPAFANDAFEAIPAVVLASFAISAPLSWFIAPRLRPGTGEPKPKRLLRVLNRVLVSAGSRLPIVATHRVATRGCFSPPRPPAASRASLVELRRCLSAR
jgi:uncharacterized membrane protein YccC